MNIMKPNYNVNLADQFTEFLLIYIKWLHK